MYEGGQQKLTSANLDRIVEAVEKRVEGNDYNFSVSTHMEAEDTREMVEIAKLNAVIEEMLLGNRYFVKRLRRLMQKCKLHMNGNSFK